jgi:hypothetical protein
MWVTVTTPIQRFTSNTDHLQYGPYSKGLTKLPVNDAETLIALGKAKPLNTEAKSTTKQGFTIQTQKPSFQRSQPKKQPENNRNQKVETLTIYRYELERYQRKGWKLQRALFNGEQVVITRTK